MSFSLFLFKFKWDLLETTTTISFLTIHVGSGHYLSDLLLAARPELLLGRSRTWWEESLGGPLCAEGLSFPAPKLLPSLCFPSPVHSSLELKYRAGAASILEWVPDSQANYYKTIHPSSEKYCLTAKWFVRALEFTASNSYPILWLLSDHLHHFCRSLMLSF